MSGYLRRYVGIYEVRADYDESTNDFPRIADGTIDPSFDDYYIKCQNGIKIRHATGSTLSCYIPSIKRGKDILCKVEDIVIQYDVLDKEVYFTFSASNLDEVVTICKARTKGKDIQPLSPKTLPKRKSIVPESEMKRYKKIFNSSSASTPIEKAQVVLKLNKVFEEKLPKSFKQDMKKLTMDFRSYLWHIGRWEEYLQFLYDNITHDKQEKWS